MDTPIDYRILILAWMAAVWLNRARHALTTLFQVPALKAVKPPETPLISVIIPAKNEEKNVGACIESLLKQDYPCFEILVANDNSTDDTEKILRSFGDKVKIVSVPRTPEGWTGKNYALHTAVPHAKGEWYLLTDADTRHEPCSLSASIAHVLQQDFKFLTLLPRCLTGSFLEAMIQPTAMGFLGLWFPIEIVNDPHSKKFFGNGQYILIERSHYRKLGGHEGVRGEFLEDFALMKKSKESGVRSQCAFGFNLYGTRMYDSLTAIWRGWRRIFLHALERRPFPLLWRSASVTVFSVIPFASFLPLAVTTFFHPGLNGFTFGVLCGLLLFILGVAWKTYRMVKISGWFAFFHPIAALLVGMILMDAGWMAVSKKKTHWR